MEFKTNLIVSSAWLLNRSTEGDRISLKLETGKTKVFTEKTCDWGRNIDELIEKT